MNLFQDFDADDAAMILDAVSGAMAQVIIGTNYPDGYKVDAYQKLKSSIQPYQNAVAGYKAKY